MESTVNWQQLIIDLTISNAKIDKNVNDISESFKTLRNKVDELDDSVKKLDGKVTSVENALEKLDKRVSKLEKNSISKKVVFAMFGVAVTLISAAANITSIINFFN